MQLIAQAATGSEAIQMFRQHQPDVTLMDLRLPDMSGIDALIAIRTEFPEARIIMLTTFEGDSRDTTFPGGWRSRLYAHERSAEGISGGDPPGSRRINRVSFAKI
jgi:CheY-like chemotaxis protein